MRVLIGCEKSQAVCIAFREKGHEAYSCDIQECSGGHPEWHIQSDVMLLLHVHSYDLIILHPPCTKIAVSGNRWYAGTQERMDAIEWTVKLWQLAKLKSPKVALENPVGTLSMYLQTPVHYIQPWQFGHGETKKTGLWLYNLPPLKPTNIVNGREQRIWKMAPGPNRAEERSKTYPGIAKAMAEQWG